MSVIIYKSTINNFNIKELSNRIQKNFKKADQKEEKAGKGQYLER